MLFKKVYTLVFIRNNTEILLGMKKRGFGCDKWNGFGGKVEPGETPVLGAARELYEECRLSVLPEDLANIGHLEFTFEDSTTLMDVRVFSATKYQGVPVETEEMAPKWFNIDKVPFDNMWADDKIWFPLMAAGKLFYGHFHYRGFDTILKYELEELESMEKFYSNRK